MAHSAVYGGQAAKGKIMLRRQTRYNGVRWRFHKLRSRLASTDNDKIIKESVARRFHLSVAFLIIDDKRNRSFSKPHWVLGKMLVWSVPNRDNPEVQGWVRTTEHFRMIEQSTGSREKIQNPFLLK
jgi:hypothetical protein